MRVRAEQACFIGGSRRKAGAEFEYNGKPASFLIPLEDPKAVENEEGVGPEEGTKTIPDDELRVKLAECGVKVKPNATREQMDAMLAEVEGKV